VGASAKSPNPPEDSPHSSNAGSTLVFVVGGRIVPADVPGLCRRADAVFAAGDPGPLICDVTGLVDVDAVAVDALARLQLVARRRRCAINLLGVSRWLADLMTLMGLCDVLSCCDSLPVEARRKPEQGEQARRIEEEGDSDDPAG